VRAPPRWALAPLLALAAGEEDAARRGLGEALASLGRRTAEREAARAALDRHRALVDAAAGRGAGSAAPAASLAAVARHGARLGAEAERLAAALRRREAAVAAVEEEWTRRQGAVAAARAAARPLEAGRERWRAARARDRERAEEDAVDEVVSARPGGGW
jgi:hypothetical protein